MKITVIVATLGRQAEAEDLTNDLQSQTRLPDQVLFCIVDPLDGPRQLSSDRFRIVMCDRKGSCAQRNIGIDAAGADSDILVFLDDDFVPAPDFIEGVETFMAAHPDCAGVTGHVLADGVTGPGLSRSEALGIVSAHMASKPGIAPVTTSRKGLYGCNMAIRASLLAGLRFDERLPLYGWLEDLDLTAQLSQRGPLHESTLLAGVHRGVKRGRTSGIRFGYSQIANPVYLLRRRRAPVDYLLMNMTRNLVANTARSIRPEPWVDRRGRLKGNLLAMGDLVSGRLDPGRILDL